MRIEAPPLEPRESLSLGFPVSFALPASPLSLSLPRRVYANARRMSPPSAPPASLRHRETVSCVFVRYVDDLGGCVTPWACLFG